MTTTNDSDGVGQAQQSWNEYERRNPRGVYQFNQMVIELAIGVPVFTRSGNENPNASPSDWGVLFHEYVHYLHNYGTLCGLKMVVLHHKLAAHLSTARAPDLPFLASAGLRADPTGTSDYGFATTLGLLSALMGDRDLPCRHADRFWFPKSAHLVASPDGATVETEVETLRTSDGYRDSGHIRLGFRALEESIAFELQRTLTTALGGPAVVPVEYPYLAIRKLRDLLCPRARLDTVTRMAILAINTENAMTYFIESLRELALARPRDHAALVYRRLPAWRARLRQIDHVRIAADLGEAYRERGSLEQAMRHIASTIAALFDRRVRNPFYEMKAATGRAGLSQLMKSVLPCEILQRTADGDVLVTVGDYHENPEEEVWARRAMQSHIHFLETHRIRDGFLSTSEVEKRDAGDPDAPPQCPYFGVCEIVQRKQSPETCARRPWEYARLDSDERCWHADGIASTFATFATPPRPKLRR